MTGLSRNLATGALPMTLLLTGCGGDSPGESATPVAADGRTPLLAAMWKIMIGP